MVSVDTSAPTPAQRPLRVAVAGTGFIGRVHIGSARKAGAEVVAVAASTPARSLEAAAALSVPTGVEQASDLLSLDIDVLHIATPNHLHAELARDALKRGIHVVIEKPVAMDLAEARTIRDLAAETGLVASVPFVYRFYPTVRHARSLVADGSIGDIRLLHGQYLQDWLMGETDSNWRVSSVAGGRSRAFADIGSHWCDLAQFISGERITRVLARTKTAITQRPAGSVEAFGGASSSSELAAVDTEDAAIVMVETESGAIGSVVVSQISPGRKNRLWLEVDGSVQSLAFDQENPESLWVGGRKANTIVVRDPDTLSAAAAPYAILPGGHPQGYGDCFDAFVADSYRAVRGEQVDGLPLIGDGVHGVAVTEAVLASAALGTWVDVEDV